MRVCKGSGCVPFNMFSRRIYVKKKSIVVKINGDILINLKPQEIKAALVLPD